MHVVEEKANQTMTWSLKMKTSTATTTTTTATATSTSRRRRRKRRRRRRRRRSGKSKNRLKIQEAPVFQKQQIQAPSKTLLRKDVKAVLVSLPEKYRHDIQHKNQFLWIAAKGKQWEDFSVDHIFGEQLRLIINNSGCSSLGIYMVWMQLIDDV